MTLVGNYIWNTCNKCGEKFTTIQGRMDDHVCKNGQSVPKIPEKKYIDRDVKKILENPSVIAINCEIETPQFNADGSHTMFKQKGIFFKPKLVFTFGEPNGHNVHFQSFEEFKTAFIRLI